MISGIFDSCNALSVLKHEKLGQHLCVGIMLVFASAAMSGDMLEITTGLAGAVVVYLMKERSSKRAPCAEKLGTTQASKRLDVDQSNKSMYRSSPHLHQAEPRIQLSFADGLPQCEQVNQLLRDILPGEADRSVCEEFAKLVSPCVRKLIPEAKIDVVAHSSVVRIGRTGLRPEVDVLVTVPPNILAQRLLINMRERVGDRSVRKSDKVMDMDENTLNKFAIRAVSEQFSFCKLWRTAFRGEEPKLVLLAPRCLGILSEDMHVHVYVNCPNTIRSKEIFYQSNSQVQKLIAFVRRWAQDRCIANTTYGHMPLYAWTLSVMSFCQSQVQGCSKYSTVDLFGAFVDFHVKRYNSASHAMAGEVLQIEDPYDAKRNVAECMSPEGMRRFGEELERAKSLLANGSGLLDIIEHYDPLPLRCVGSVPQSTQDVPDSVFSRNQASISNAEDDAYGCAHRDCQAF